MNENDINFVSTFDSPSGYVKDTRWHSDPRFSIFELKDETSPFMIFMTHLI